MNISPLTELLARAHQARTGAHPGLGAVPTPQPWADRLAALALPLRLPGPPPRVLDLACGTGDLLVAALRRLAALYPEVPPYELANLLYGADLDPHAIEWAKRALRCQVELLGGAPSDLSTYPGHWSGGCSLLAPEPGSGRARLWPEQFPHGIEGQFPAAILNPPYVSGIRSATAAERSHRARLRAAYCTARGAFDLSVPFQQRAFEALAPGGRLAAVVPDKTLGAHWAAKLRAFLATEGQLEALIDPRNEAPFGRVAVYPILYAVRSPSAHPPVNGPLTRRSRHLGAHSWAPLLQDSSDLPASFTAASTSGPRLGDYADVCGSMTVGEAYLLRPYVREGEPREGEPREDTPGLLTSGVLASYGHQYGHKSQRYLGQQYRWPVFDLRCGALSDRRVHQLGQPRLVVAGLVKVPRGAVVAPGFAGSVGTFTITIRPNLATPQDEPNVWLWALAAALHHPDAAAHLRASQAASTLRGGYIQITRQSLERLPVPELEQVSVAQLAASAQGTAAANPAFRGVCM